MRMDFRLGDSHVVLENEIIVQVRRDDIIISRDDDRFDGGLLYILLHARNYHQSKLLTLIRNLNPAKDCKAKQALYSLKEYINPIDIVDEIDNALAKKT